MDFAQRLILAEQQLEQAKANANFWAGQVALLKELLAPAVTSPSLVPDASDPEAPDA